MQGREPIVADRLKLIDTGEGDTITILIKSYTCFHSRGSSETQEQRKEDQKRFKDMPGMATSLFGYADVSGLVLHGKKMDYRTNESVEADIRVQENALSEDIKNQLDKAEAAYAGDIYLNDDSLDVFLIADAGTRQILVSGISNNSRCELHLTVGRILNTERAWIQKFSLNLSGKTADWKPDYENIDDELEVDPDDERHWGVIKKLNSIELMIFWLFALLAFIVAVLFFK